ncbi:MAG: tryptophan halogenase family protein [Pseudomonadota bacterium]
MSGDKPITSVVVVGGGTAGWLTASILAADHCASEPDGLRVTLVESETVPILGVGEGTWPSLRDTLRRIGISETTFIRRCNAAFKQGSRFNGWRDGSAADSYFHPFEAPPSQDDADLLRLWQSAGTDVPFADAVCHQPAVCRAGLAPKQAGTPEYAAVANYAYHLDAPAFAELLCEHATEKLGVRHILADVTGAERGENGDIARVTTAEHGPIAADLFIDCTGSRSLLVGDALCAPLTDVSDVLFNDRALACHVPYPDQEAPVASETHGTALSSGWVWDIGLQTRRGVGYVHASNFISEDDARRDLQGYLDRTAPGQNLSADDARLIKFTSAYRETPWVKNCVAIGMSAGFVEPLEASAIVMIELAASMVSENLPPTRSAMQGTAKRFNARASYRWSRIVDFLKAHYILSERKEAYWMAHRDQATWTDRLVELMERWKAVPPSREDFTQTQEIFPAASYAYVLYGMGFATAMPATTRRRGQEALLRMHRDAINTKQRRFSEGLPGHRQLLNHIQNHGLTRS